MAARGLASFIETAIRTRVAAVLGLGLHSPAWVDSALFAAQADLPTPVDALRPTGRPLR